MAMSQATLATQFKAMALFANEAAAAAAWSSAFHTYFRDAEAAVAGSIGVFGLRFCSAAMESALSGMSASNQAATKSQEAVLAYWAAIIPAAAWPSCTSVTPPPGLSGLTAALISVFAANNNPGVTKDQAYDAIAAAIHSVNSSGGIAVFPVSPGIGPQPIT